MRKILTFACLLCMLSSCEEQEPRRPVEVRSGSFLKASAERNKRLLEEETTLMQELARKDSMRTYQNSASGFMYAYEKRSAEDGPLAKPGDLVTLTYDIRTWNEDTLYRREEIGMRPYLVDKEELFPGMRAGAKMLKEGESAVFYFPSSLGFGYHGDDVRIGPNTPLKCTLEIFKIESETEIKID